MLSVQNLHFLWKTQKITIEDVIRIAKERFGIDELDCESIIEDLKRKGSIYEPKPAFVKVLE